MARRARGIPLTALAPIAGLARGARLLVLTGAGVSAESGILTFRGMGGLWQRYRVEELASPVGFARDPRLVWSFYAERRRHAATCAPNPGHAALAQIERRLGDIDAPSGEALPPLFGVGETRTRIEIGK